MRSWLLSTTVAAILCATTADAQVVPEQRGGAPGFWVPRAEFLRLDKLDRTAPLMLEEIGALREANGHLRVANAALVRSASAATDLARINGDALKVERAEHLDTLRDLGAAQREAGLLRHPELWALAGALVAGALAVGMSHAIK
jgi:hypothetical protein